MGETVRVRDLRVDGGLQSRSSLREDVVKDYADAMKAGVAFPPIDVYYDGNAYWLADGFHRHAAAQQAQLAELDATIHQGTRRDAVLASVGANAVHGLRRSADDKRRAVRTLLMDDEWSQWSDREIARKCNVWHEMVGNLRREVEAATQRAVSLQRTYVTKHGGVASMQISGLSARAALPLVADDEGLDVDAQAAAAPDSGSARSLNHAPASSPILAVDTEVLEAFAISTDDAPPPPQIEPQPQNSSRSQQQPRSNGSYGSPQPAYQQPKSQPRPQYVAPEPEPEFSAEVALATLQEQMAKHGDVLVIGYQDGDGAEYSLELRTLTALPYALLNYLKTAVDFAIRHHETGS